jgi:hypothetical protein
MQQQISTMMNAELGEFCQSDGGDFYGGAQFRIFSAQTRSGPSLDFARLYKSR